MKKLTQEQFITKAVIIHNGKYDYSKVIYKSGKDKINIICPIHGLFQQRPYNHSKGEGCPKCKYDLMRTQLALTLDDFKEKANKIHNRRYDYSKVVYINSKTKINIICPEHGDFFQLSGNHLQGQTCPECANIIISNKNRKTTEDFILDSKKIHEEKYNYSNVNYKGKDENINIICKKHGNFIQSPHNHLHGAGCPKCKSSKGEQKIINILDKKGIEYYPQKMFINCRSPKGRMLKFDFHIPVKNLLIEYDGPQHFGDLRIGKYTLKKQEYERLQISDDIKNKYAKNNNITLIRIPYWELNNIKDVLDRYL